MSASATATAMLITFYLIFLSCNADKNYSRSDSQFKQEVETLHYVVSEHSDSDTLVADIIANARLRHLLSPEVVDKLYFRFLSAPPVGMPMSIDRKTGIVRTAGDIDREALRQCRHVEICRLPVDVAIGPAAYFRIIRVSVEIVDVNDNAPYFQQSNAVVRVRESAPAGSSYALPVAVDADGPLYGVQRYDLTSSTSKLALSVESRRPDSKLVPRLMVLGPLDRELETEYQLRLTAYDGGLPTLSATVDILVQVLDSNDHSPVFESELYEVDVREDVPVGTVIVQVQVIISTLQCSRQ